MLPATESIRATYGSTFGLRSSHTTKRRETSTVEYGADESEEIMNLRDLIEVVDNAKRIAEERGTPIDEYPVYTISRGSVIHDIKSWSPRDFNRGGVAFIER